MHWRHFDRFSFGRFFLSGLVAAILAFTPAARADDDEVGTAKARLARQIELLGLIQEHVDEIHMSRLFVLKLISQKVLDSIKVNGYGSNITYDLYQDLIVRYTFSVSFFSDIETDHTRESIGEILRIHKAIVDSKGASGVGRYTTITAIVYTQMRELFLQLLQLTLPDELRRHLEDLMPKIGKVIAEGKGGDRRLLYDISLPLCQEISSLYRLFSQISVSDAAFNIVSEIQGLNQIYAEFAQVGKNRPEDKQ